MLISQYRRTGRESSIDCRIETDVAILPLHNGSGWQLLGRSQRLLARARCDRQRILETADDARFALQSLRVDDGIVSSWSAHSRRAIAREPASPMGFPNVASTMIRAPSTEDLWRYGAGCLVNLVDSVAHNPRHIQNFAALCQVVKSRGAST
jgi:hypothetical protein